MRDFDFSPVPVGDILDQAVRRFGPRPAMDFFGQRTSYAQLGRLVERAAAGLQGLGVRRGVNVGLCLPNCPYFVVMYYAILKAGGTVVNFNPLYTAHEIQAQVRDAQVQIIVSLDLAMIHDKIAPLVETGVLRQVIVCPMAAALPWRKGILFRLFKANDIAIMKPGAKYFRFEQLIAGTQMLAPVVIDPGRDIAVLQFTGGTTGTPKAAMLTHANVGVNVAQVRAVIPPVTLGAERFLAVLPFFHVFAMTAIMNLGLDIGAELILLPRAEIKPLMATIRRTRPTLLPGVPTLFTAISNAAEVAKRFDLSSIKFCISGGAPISAEVMDRFERISHSIIIEGYGLSETSPVVTFNVPGAVKRGSVGPAVPGTVIEIRDRTDPTVLLAQGERGEICVRGPQVMRGYYQKPADTRATFVDGSLRTGDIGYLDEDGYLFIVDRIKDLILCGGYNVYPRVIEEAAYQHPAVQDAIAIGVPDKYRGQAPKLYVSLRPGQSATEAEILKFLATILNKIEMPKVLVIRASLPKTMVGKLSKKELVAEEAAHQQPDV
ncbi:long-chain fatty acid--CoA ligase [Acidocella sp.]|uniref:long-chain-fatty-acid--CoA ligase n=1 Tax=Acidocella sp. TaxID=50710 RepID=UPI0017A31CE8|nr:long-chain fatty acid--CoA ligase [Acidocella sp.]NNM56261.1 long-chain fatty acid--CoA ligase [Acidocella sp.]